MMKSSFCGTHREVGFRWGAEQLSLGRRLLDEVPFPLTDARREYADACVPVSYTHLGYVTYIINTREYDDSNEVSDGYQIRRCASENNVTVFTALDTVRVLLDVLEETTMTISTIDAAGR